ncbi:MAG: hypothetical protein ACRDUX_10585 [Mycobacterium sp.]
MSDFEGRLACVIGADGAIARGYRIVKCERTGVGDYTILWEDELRGSMPLRANPPTALSISPSSATECRHT